MNKNRDVLSFLKTIPFFQHMNEKEMQLLLEKVKTKTYKKNDILFNFGEDAEYFFIMRYGWIKLFNVNKEGEETVIYLATKGDYFSEVATFEGSSYPYSAQVVGGSVECLAFSAKVIRDIIREDRELALKMLSSMCHRNNQLSLKFENVSRLTSAQRFARFLYKLSMDRAGALKIQLPYNKNLIASRLGMKAETFSRSIKRLDDDLGIKIIGREVLIKNIDDLQEYCEADCFLDNICNNDQKITCNNPQCEIYRILRLM